MNNEIIKIHLFMCNLIQHELESEEDKKDLKEYIESWLIMVDD